MRINGLLKLFSVFLFLLTISIFPAYSQSEQAIKDKCNKVKRDGEWVLYSCHNHAQVNVVNDHDGKVVMEGPSTKIPYKIHLALPDKAKMNFTDPLTVTITHFGPNSKFEQEVGKILEVQVQDQDGNWHTATGPDYKLSQPISVTVTNNVNKKEIPQETTLDARIKFGRESEMKQLSILSAFVNARYKRKISKWIQDPKERKVPSPKYETVETNEGTTLEVKQYKFDRVPGELEAVFWDPPTNIGNKGYIHLENINGRGYNTNSNSASADTPTEVVINDVENLVTGKDYSDCDGPIFNPITKATRAKGYESTRCTITVLNPGQSDMWKFRVDYTVREMDGENVIRKDSHGIVLRNPVID